MKKKIIISQLPSMDYISRFRNIDKFIECCKKCPRYKNIWSCPPFDRESEKEFPYSCSYELQRYELTTILGVQIFIDEERRSEAKDVEQRNQLIQDILLAVRKEMDPKLLELEQAHDHTLLFYAGSCILCPKNTCKRITGEGCRHPDKIRSTLEAHGFDIGMTTSELLNIELKWCNDCELPPYFTLVYGLFSNTSLIEQLKLTIGQDYDFSETISHSGQ